MNDETSQQIKSSRTLARTRYLGRQPTESEMVGVVAVERFTRSTAFGIVHMDPNGRDPRARKNMLRRDVAENLENEGKLKIVADLKAATAMETVETRAIRRVARSADIEREVLGRHAGLTGSSTRDTTAFQRDPAMEARTVDGIEDISENGSEDDDEEEDREIDPLFGTSNREEQDAPAPVDEDLEQQRASGADAPPADEDDDDDGETEQEKPAEDEQPAQTGRGRRRKTT